MIATMQRVWNFVVTGETRAGAGAVVTAINRRDGAVCHAGLFHPDPAVRRAAHESYFGESDPDDPAWYVDGRTNPWQYINGTVLDHPHNGETAVGLYVSYGAARELDLFELFEARVREGDFGVLHVVRNPVACFVSRKQAEQTGRWAADHGDPHPARLPQPLRIDPAELVQFCRDHAATASKVRACASDRLDVSYAELVFDYQAAMRKVFDHIELPELPALARPGCRRLRNRAVLDRIANLADLRAGVSSEVRRLLDADDLV